MQKQTILSTVYRGWIGTIVAIQAFPSIRLMVYVISVTVCFLIDREQRFRGRTTSDLPEIVSARD